MLKLYKLIYMGIKGLYDFLRQDDSLFMSIPLETYFGERIAIDTSVYLYKYLYNKNNWIDRFIQLIVKLRKNNIRPIFVFDGIRPIQKHNTQQTRRIIHNKLNKIQEYLDIIDEYLNIETIPINILNDIYLLINECNIKTKSNLQLILNNLFKKIEKKCIKVTEREIVRLQELLTAMGLPWLKASGEAEKSCAWLCKSGYVKSVLTTDSDIIVYGVPQFIKNLSVNTCTVLTFSSIIDWCNLSETQFTDFCILCGTDYNDRIKGNGPRTVYQSFLNGKYIELLNKIPELNIIRELFRLPGNDEGHLMFENWTGILQIKPVNKIDLSLLLVKSNSEYNINKVIKCYEPQYVILNKNL